MPLDHVYSTLPIINLDRSGTNLGYDHIQLYALANMLLVEASTPMLVDDLPNDVCEAALGLV